MYLLIILLSVFGSCLAGLFGKHLGFKGSIFITMNCLLCSFGLSLFLFYEVIIVSCPVYIKLATWLNVELLHIDWGFVFDSLTVFMCVIVLFVSFLVHAYSTEYMGHDPHLPRFMCYLSLFTFFMLILISADNFLQMFVGWEGVGLCSYLLINFWFTRIQANKAAIKAMLLNRIGDFSLLIAIFLIFTTFKSVDYNAVEILVPFFKSTFVNILFLKVSSLESISLFMFIGAIGKSAQIGLHTWLPDAMEGPTPVSALIHAATMVTAGVFLITRTSFIYDNATYILHLITITGSLTAFFAATTGLLQNDLKRVVAYSTCSQLGYMIFACGLSNYSAGFFHLINHAFFKALLFLSAGSIIHSIHDEQDMRKMGGLKRLIPFTYSMIIVGSLALIGFPFFTGFYSKDLILELAYSKYNFSGFFSFCLGTIVAYLTAYYSMRLIFMTFLVKPSGYKKILCSVFDSGYSISITLSLLAFPSVVLGYYSKEVVVGLGNNILNCTLYINFKNHNFLDAEFMNIFLKNLPICASLLGFFSAYILYIFNLRMLFYLKSSQIGKKIYYFLNRKWFFDKIYNEYISQTFFKFAYSTSYKFIDKGIFEILGPTGFSIIILDIGSKLNQQQTGYIYHYTSILLIFLSLFFCLTETWCFFEFFIDYRLFILFTSLNFFIINKKCNG